MTAKEWRRAGYMSAVIIGLHLIGFGILLLVVLPAKYKPVASGTPRGIASGQSGV